MGEYLEDYSDVSTWDVAGLSKWAMSSFGVSLSTGKIKQQSPDEIEQQLIEAAGEQIDKRDCSQLNVFLRKDYSVRTLSEWVKAKFDIKIEIDELQDLNAAQVCKLLMDRVHEKYKQREIEYPVEFAMNMVYARQQGAGFAGAQPNAYAFETLANWANARYNAGLTLEKVQETKPQKLHKQLLELSSAYNNGRLEEEISEKIASLNIEELTDWANKRFVCSLRQDELSGETTEVSEKLQEIGREFLRTELSKLEKYILTEVYDSSWKDHLYAMDQLKGSIWMRSMAEKDPKTEFKREGYRMFDEMLEAVEDRVTGIIFKVRLEAGARARNLWNVSRTSHDQVGQFAMAERQRAAAQAPQGEVKTKQIKLATPKVGRNEPCPCGSGKKYKKCHGKEA